MAHFALLDENNMVLNVLVIANEQLLDNDGNEVEQLGVDFLHKIGLSGKWKQCSYNGNFRHVMADPNGGYYDEINDVFIIKKPYQSWILDDNFDWKAPFPAPDQDKYWWNEPTQTWELFPAAEATDGSDVEDTFI